MSRRLSVPILVGVMAVPAAATPDTDISIPASSCRWDPTDDYSVEPHSGDNEFWIVSDFGAPVELYCSLPLYYGNDTGGHSWGMSAASLAAGEIAVPVTAGNGTQARIIQIDASDGSSAYSLCSFVSGYGDQIVLYPPPCTLAYGIVQVQVNIPGDNASALYGVMVDDVN